MESILNTLRELVGNTNGFFHLLPNSGGTSQSYQWDYGLMLEYACAVILISLVIVNVFKLIRVLFK